MRLRAQVNSALRRAMERRGSSRSRPSAVDAERPKEHVSSRSRRACSAARSMSCHKSQIAKQLLMVGGFDRYYQIARCMRDETYVRIDSSSSPSSTIEASFVGQAEILEFVSEAVIEATFAVSGERPPAIATMTWNQALDRFGTDKPDLRFGMELVDLTESVARR